MAPLSQSVTAKAKRPPGIITNGIHSSTSSPSPSMSASRLPGGGAKYPPNSAPSNGVGSSTSGVRSANRARRDAPGQLLGRGQRNSSVGLRSASIAGDLAVQQVADPPPYIKTDDYILKKYRGNPPSLIIHLHQSHFRFDQQEGSFSYKSPMRVVIENLRTRTVPHDLMEFFSQNNIEFYEGCLIVQVVDHKSTAPAQESIRTNSTTTKSIPFSVHNHNACLTPSPWVPYPSQNGLPGKRKASPEGDAEDVGKPKSSEQKDKENMPAPAFPADGRGKAGQPKKPKTSTIVLHPTPISDHADLMIKAVTARSANASDPSGPLSATVPPTPSTAVPQTPQTSMAPPAKRIKRTRMELDRHNLHAATSQIVLATTAPLALEPVNNVAEASALLESLAHPMHSAKPPSQKTRKRTVAEMAADEEFAAAQERYMLIFDEKNAASAQGGANAGDGDGQAGGVFEPRFERFKVLENIRNQHEDNKKSEKARQQEAERKNLQDRERERLRLDAEKKLEQERMRNVQMQQAAAQRQQLSQQQEAQRRAMAQAAQQPQQAMQGIPPQAQQHPHPQPNGLMQNGIQSQPQRFHQQVSQAQISSPIVRNGTPQSHSSPTVNNMGNIPMQHSTSSMGGSPPRPGSAVNPQMSGPASHGMTAQRSQQSHAGTPRMPSVTPNVQSTPLNRQMSQTPRMSQASPLQGSMAQTPHIPQQMMNNGQPMNLNTAQQQALALQQQQAIMQQRMQRQREAALAQGLQMNAGQPMNQQQQTLQAHLMRTHQQQAAAAAQQGGNAIPQLAQNYQAQMAAMARQTGAMPQNMNFNAQGMNMQQMQQAMQMQQMQQMQAQQAQQQAQAHAQNQQHPQMNAQAVAQAQQNAMLTKSIQNAAAALYQQHFPNLQAQYPNGVPEEAMRNLRAQCQQQATQQVHSTFRARRQMQQHQQQMMAAQQGGMNPNGMNGMNMQRPNGM